MISESELLQLEAEAMKAMPPSALEAWIKYCHAKAHLAGYACSQIGAPEDFQSDCRATMRFCYGLADKAESALAARRAEATARSAGGFR